MRYQRDPAQQQHDGQEGGRLRPADPAAQQIHEDRRDDDAPHRRRRVQKRQPREGRYAEQAPQDVETVGGQGREGGEGARHLLGDESHGGRDQREHERQAQPDRQRSGAEKPDHAVVASDLDLKEKDEGQEHREDHGRLPEVLALRARPQEPDADAEKARQQHEVGEVGEVQHVGRAPADQHELEKQHQEAEDEEPDLTAGAGLLWRRALRRRLAPGAPPPLAPCARPRPAPAPQSLACSHAQRPPRQLAQGYVAGAADGRGRAAPRPQSSSPRELSADRPPARGGGRRLGYRRDRARRRASSTCRPAAPQRTPATSHSPVATRPRLKTRAGCPYRVITSRARTVPVARSVTRKWKRAAPPCHDTG